MPEARSNPQPCRTPAASATEPERSRKPFVRPQVQQIGALKELTLLGGSL